MKKKVLSILLALCIVAGTLPVCALAEEAAVKDSNASELHVRIPTSEVQARLAKGTDYLDKYGVTREKIIKELSAHEHDGYYLDTPFVGGDWQSPRGDTSYNGAPGTNCAGFVAYVLRKCGLNTKEVLETMRSSSRFTRWGSGLFADGLSSASNYMSLAEKGKLIAYAYPTKAAMLAGGKLEKGDIILRFWTDAWGGYDEDNHLMIFWGSTPYEDKVWQNASGRLHIGPMWSGDASSFVVIKFAPLKPPSPPVAGFDDVHEDDWYAEGVRYVKEKGLMNGEEANRFAPSHPVTRGQLVAILWRLAGKPETAAQSGFTDVREGEYYTFAINWAVERGIVRGYGDGAFGPNDDITRQDLAVILRSYCQSQGMKCSESVDLSLYEDFNGIAGYAMNSLEWASAVGLINGTSKTKLSPGENASRCQAASILMRFCENVVKTED